MKMSKFRLATVSIAILTIALLTVYFLVQDIYRLQKEYEIVSAPLEYRGMTEDQYRWIREQLDEIQTTINLRKTAVVLVVAATAVTLLVLNKRKLFKEKYALKPELNTLEARHRLALIEGQKENKKWRRKNAVSC